MKRASLATGRRPARDMERAGTDGGITMVDEPLRKLRLLVVAGLLVVPAACGSGSGSGTGSGKSSAPSTASSSPPSSASSSPSSSASKAQACARFKEAAREFNHHDLSVKQFTSVARKVEYEAERAHDDKLAKAAASLMARMTTGDVRQRADAVNAVEAACSRQGS
jgi:hypothetical protein